MELKKALRARAGDARRLGIVMFVGLLPSATNFYLNAQASHATVRHRRVEEHDPVAEKLSTAEDAIAKQDYASAEPLLKEVVSERPDDYAAWYDLGFLYHAQSRNDESIEAYRKSVQAKSTVFESNLNLGLGLASVNNPEAEKFLRAATKLTPTSNPQAGQKRAWLALGHFLEQRNPEEAVRAFRQAATLDPKDPDPHLSAASTLEKLNNPEAEQEYQLALEADPHSSDAMAALSNLYMAQHRYEDAEHMLRKLVSLRPDDAGSHIQLGRMLVISGKSEEASTELETGVKLDPADGNAQRDLAEVYVDLKNFAATERIYSALLARSPNDAGLHQRLGRAFFKDKKYGEAESEFIQAVHINANMAEAYGDLALAANENKHYPLVIQALDIRGKLLAENAATYFLRATAYDHMSDAKQASKYYHEFLNVADENQYRDQVWQAKHRLIAIEPNK